MRKGATKKSAVDPNILEQLNTGQLETATLTEELCVDNARLFSLVFPELVEHCKPILDSLAEMSITAKMQQIGQLLAEQLGDIGITRCLNHKSNIVRGWGCYCIAARPYPSIKDRLSAIAPFAKDLHYGVREWAWLAIRPHMVLNLPETLTLLQKWTLADSANQRRFAVESIRPRGVWCQHIRQLKEDPSLALPVLENLRADPDKYVQTSVGNWLNDASKDNPEWVQTLCAHWCQESSSPATAYICKRALRSIKK